MNIGPMSLPRSDNKKMDYTYSTCYYRLWYFFFFEGLFEQTRCLLQILCSENFLAELLF